MAETPSAWKTVIRWSLRLTWAGVIAERITRAFWPFWSVVMLALTMLTLGLHQNLPVELVWTLAVLILLGALATLIYGLRAFRWPRRAVAMARLDATLPGQPLQTVQDEQAIGAGDPASEALWQVHQTRMARQLRQARAVRPNLQVARFDPFALRYVAMLGLAVGLLFGSLGRLGQIGELGQGAALAAGPSWEGWVEPPHYTGLPVLYLADQFDDVLNLPQGSQITLRFYGEVGALTLAETISGRTGDVPPASDPEQSLTVTQDGELEIHGKGGRHWQVALQPDAVPMAQLTGPAETSFDGQMSLPFRGEDDYGIVSGQLRIALDLDAVDRRYGLALTPEPRSEIQSSLPLPISGSRSDFTESIVENFSQHPWAHLPVTVTLEVTDAAGQTGQSPAVKMTLPARKFFDPLAAALIEQRRDLLWNRKNASQVARVLRAVSWKPEENLFSPEAAYLQFRVILRRLEGYAATGLSDQARDEIAEALWNLALDLEEGDINDALQRMQQAQERLSEAMKNGASEEEIAELMQELRDATQDYLRQLSRQAQQDQEQQSDEFESAENQQNSMQMDMNDLQRMMDRIQELMEQGRMAEAQQALEELQQMMENMRVTEGGEGQRSPGQQAMDNLAETLRDQQGLSDQAFRDLQEQFNPGANSGQSQSNQGRNGSQGQGQSHEGQNGDGQGSDGAPSEQSLAERQRALRDELNRQRGNLPGEGTEAGRSARDALDQAERAMRGAEDALENDDLAGAIDQQAEAMDALRDGIRNLGEAMAEAQREQQDGQGDAQGNAQTAQRDPLGRNPGGNGNLGGDQSLLQGEDVYRRARELLDEIRRRSGESDRSQEELNYLQRLLERF